MDIEDTHGGGTYFYPDTGYLPKLIKNLKCSSDHNDLLHDMCYWILDHDLTSMAHTSIRVQTSSAAGKEKGTHSHRSCSC